MEVKQPTHTAYAAKREGQHLRWLEIGVAFFHDDGHGCDIYIDRLPVGGFSGHILVRTKDAKPEEAPSRPALPAEG